MLIPFFFLNQVEVQQQVYTRLFQRHHTETMRRFNVLD
jgi:hypothetical protein